MTCIGKRTNENVLTSLVYPGDLGNRHIGGSVAWHRHLAKFRARVQGYFWLPCPRCGRMFAGFECGKGSVEQVDGSHRIACKWCPPYTLFKRPIA